MQQNYRRAFAQHAVDDFGIATLNLPKNHTGYEFVTRCVAKGAASNSGSSGITIQAMG
jgi:hypothetical protein